MPLLARQGILVCGTGRAARSLVGALSACGPIVGVASRDPIRGRAFAAWAGVPYATDGAALPAADTVAVLVEDGAIGARAEAIAARAAPGALWLHMAGSLGSATLAGATARAAGTPLAFHPLAVLDGEPRDLRGVVVGLEGDAAAVAAGEAMATALGATPVVIAAAHRVAYHLAATMASGHLIGLLAAATRVADGADLPPEVAQGLLALAAEALAATRARGARAAFTGALARGDRTTVERHLSLLDGGEDAVRRAYDAAGLAALTYAAPAGDDRDGARREIGRLLADDLARRTDDDFKGARR